MTGWAYYNEKEKFAVEWLRRLIKARLIPDGEVDPRDIRDVDGADLHGFTQVHLFAGIAGWAEALRLAQWPADIPVWTGSCPCQPFSSAGKRKGFDDERHLWPEFRRLVEQCRPSVIFGEQVARATDWLALVRSDLEALAYSVGAMPIEAASVGALHRRDRFWFVAHAKRAELRQQSRWSGRQDGPGQVLIGEHGSQWLVADTYSQRQQERGEPNGATIEPQQQTPRRLDVGRRGEALAYSPGIRLPRTTARQECAGWVEFEHCSSPTCDANVSGLALPERQSRDVGAKLSPIERANWWAVEPGMGRVAHGVLGRVGQLRAFGNAIVPQVAAEVIRCFV